jgi:hypothetical protein
MIGLWYECRCGCALSHKVMSKWPVTEAPGSGPLVMLAGASDTGMVSVYVPNEMAWVTPATAERMATALTFAARATRRQR